MSSSAVARVLRCRARTRDGKRVFAITLDEVATEALLIREGLLADGVELERRDVDRALQAFLEGILEAENLRLQLEGR